MAPMALRLSLRKMYHISILPSICASHTRMMRMYESCVCAAYAGFGLYDDEDVCISENEDMCILFNPNFAMIQFRTECNRNLTQIQIRNWLNLMMCNCGIIRKWRVPFVILHYGCALVACGWMSQYDSRFYWLHFARCTINRGRKHTYTRNRTLISVRTIMGFQSR